MLEIEKLIKNKTPDLEIDGLDFYRLKGVVPLYRFNLISKISVEGLGFEALINRFTDSYFVVDDGSELLLYQINSKTLCIYEDFNATKLS